MKKNIYYFSVLFLVITFAACTKNTPPTTNEQNIPQMEAPVEISYKTFTSLKHNYTLEVPVNWQANEEANQVTFTPDSASSSAGTIDSASLKSVSTANAETSLTTEEEFQQLRALDPAASPTPDQRYFKLDDVEVDGNQGVLFVDGDSVDENSQDWNVTAWWREDSVNYYFTAEGDTEMGLPDLDIIMKAVETFTKK